VPVIGTGDCCYVTAATLRVVPLTATCVVLLPPVIAFTRVRIHYCRTPYSAVRFTTAVTVPTRVNYSWMLLHRSAMYTYALMSHFAFVLFTLYITTTVLPTHRPLHLCTFPTYYYHTFVYSPHLLCVMNLLFSKTPFAYHWVDRFSYGFTIAPSAYCSFFLIWILYLPCVHRY